MIELYTIPFDTDMYRETYVQCLHEYMYMYILYVHCVTMYLLLHAQAYVYNKYLQCTYYIL